MVKNYETYTAEQLLEDDYFLTSIQEPTSKAAVILNKLAEKDPIFAAEMSLARQMFLDLQMGMSAGILSEKEQSKLWERIELANQENEKNNRKSLFLYRLIGIAASICLLVIGGWHFLLNQADMPDYLALLDQVEPKAVSSRDVILIEKDGNIVTLKGDRPHLDVRNDLQAEGEHVLFVPAGKQASVEFPDHSLMEINAGTKVVFNSCFSNDHREIFVEGEAFLSVKRDEKRPFSVKMRQMNVTVLGTEFNVSSYKDDMEAQVVLVKGSVSVDVKGGEKSYKLDPDQLFCLDKKSNDVRVDDVNASDYIVWKDGYYLFNQVELGVVLKKLERFFGKPIRWDNTINTYRCSGKLDLKGSLEEVLNMLVHLAPIQIKDSGDYIQIDIQD